MQPDPARQMNPPLDPEKLAVTATGEVTNVIFAPT